MPSRKAFDAPPSNTPSANHSAPGIGWGVKWEAQILLARRFALWAAVSVLLTCGISAATHFLTPLPPDAQADVSGSDPTRDTSSMNSTDATWWDAEKGLDTQLGLNTGGNAADVPAGSGKSLIPVDHSADLVSSSPLSAGALVAVNVAPTYAVLGLSTSNNPAPLSFSANAIGAPGAQGALISFSLSGDVNLLSPDNSPAGGLDPRLLAVPEPTARLLLASGLVCLLWMRRRTAEWSSRVIT